MVRVIESGLEEADTYGAREAWAGYLSQLKKQAEKSGPLAERRAFDELFRRRQQMKAQPRGGRLRGDSPVVEPSVSLNPVTRARTLPRLRLYREVKRSA